MRCLWCGFVYDEALGLPEAGSAPGTRWDDVPDDWVCPDCRAPEADFRMVVLDEQPRRRRAVRPGRSR